LGPCARQSLVKLTGMERDGMNGKKGEGPRFASMMDIANAFAAGADALETELAKAGDIRDRGTDAMARMREAAADGDMTAFMNAANGVDEAIVALNAVDPKLIINTIGAVIVSKEGIDLTEETADFHASAEDALKDRVTVEAPTFVPFSVGEATRKQVVNAAMHGWILAGAIDVLPLLCLCLAFAISREVAHQQLVKKPKLTVRGRVERDTETLRQIRPGRDSDEVPDNDDKPDQQPPFKDAAE